MKWIHASDISSWVTTKQTHCSRTLPELVRRLILKTAASVEEIDFSSGDSVVTGGWDGRLKTTAKSLHFPDGNSGWEISIEHSPGQKAESDFAKRTEDPLGLVPSDTTFVFVTPLPWPKRGEWESENAPLNYGKMCV